MRSTLIGGLAVGVLALGCADKPLSGENLASIDQEASVALGNAPATGLNAPATGLNAPATGLNAPTTGLNAPGTGLNAPATGLNTIGFHAFGPKARAQVQDDEVPYYIVSNELTTIVQPRPLPASDIAGVDCAGKGFTRVDAWGNSIQNWRFARTYRGAASRIVSSDIELLRPSGWSAIRGQVSPLVFPAKLTSLGATTAPLDAIVMLTRKRSSAYACSLSYRAIAFDVAVSIVRDGRCFPWVVLGTTTFVPAVKSLMPRYIGATHAGLVPRGDGWAIPVSADGASALFKALHYSQAILDFDDATNDDSTAWQYRYPTTATSCDPNAIGSGAANCLDGASIVAGYGLALTNVIPFVLRHADPLLDVVVGHPGTVTGMSVFVSVMKAGRLVRSTQFETTLANQTAVQLAPGATELASSSPFHYDAAIGAKASGRSCMGSVRVGIGLNRQRVSAMESWTSTFSDPYRSTALAAYNSGCSEYTEPYNIAQLSFAGDFVVSALPVANTTACPATVKPWIDTPNDVFVFDDLTEDPES